MCFHVFTENRWRIRIQQCLDCGVIFDKHRYIRAAITTDHRFTVTPMMSPSNKETYTVTESPGTAKLVVYLPMKIPEKYSAWRNELGFDEVSFGVGGIQLFPLHKIDEGQIGYARSEEGDSLCDGAEDSWKPEWIVIGYEIALGDPVFVDTSNPEFPVMTAMHGERTWDPLPVAKSLEAFATILRAIHGISTGRKNPAELEQNPLSNDEREHTLQVIRNANKVEIETDFWEAMLRSDPNHS